MELTMGPFVWLALVAVLLVIEAVTVGLTTVWFAAGAGDSKGIRGKGAGPDEPPPGWARARLFSGSCFWQYRLCF